MNTGRIKTTWVIAALYYYTIKTSIKCLIKYFFSGLKRPWVDNTLHEWIDSLLNEVRVQYRVVNPHNTEPPAGRAIILMCNHSSSYDIPLGFKAFPNHSIRMLAKKELSKIPLFGSAMAAAEFPFIDRKNRYQAIKDLEYARQLMESGIILWIAPEGTRSKDGKLAPFKKGAFITAIQAKAIIIPIGIRGAFDIMPAATFSINFDQKAEIHIGKPIDATQFTIENKEELIKQTFAAVKELVGE